MDDTDVPAWMKRKAEADTLKRSSELQTELGIYEFLQPELRSILEDYESGEVPSGFIVDLVTAAYERAVDQYRKKKAGEHVG